MTSRVDAPLKVTGEARYGADHTFPGMVSNAYYVLSVIESDQERLRTYRDSGRIKLPDCMVD